MKIKTKYYGISYKSRGKWIAPSESKVFDFYTFKELIAEYKTIPNYLKEVRKQFKKPVKLMIQTWESV